MRPRAGLLALTALTALTALAALLVSAPAAAIGTEEVGESRDPVEIA